MEWQCRNELTGHTKELMTVVGLPTEANQQEDVVCSHGPHQHHGPAQPTVQAECEGLVNCAFIHQQILCADGLQDWKMDNGDEGGAATTRALQGWAHHPRCGATLKQVQNLRSYKWCKAGCGHGTITMMLEWTLHDKNISPFILYPMAHACLWSTSMVPSSGWCVQD